MKSIRLPEDSRFTCQSCGQCCQGWAIPVEQDTVDNLRAHDWGTDPFEKSSGGDEAYHIKLVDGRCFFLDRDNRCRIHVELSYEAKPFACRAFPLAVLDFMGTRYARLSYWCPTVVTNTGKPLEHQARWLNEIAKHEDRRIASVTLNEGVALSARDFERVHQALRRFIKDGAFPIGDRLAAAAALIRELDDRTRTDAKVVEAVVKGAESTGIATLASHTRRTGQVSSGRRALSLYLLHDRPAGRAALLARLLALITYNAGLTALRSRAIGAGASWRGMRKVAFRLSTVSEELLTRYLCSKLDSRRYLAGEANLVNGFNLLIVAYGVINLLARTRAASLGMSVCDEEDVRLAVRASDLLVMEHSVQDGGRLHAKLTASLLNDRNLPGDVLASIS